MRIIDTRFRPGTPDTFRGILSNPLYKSFSETTNFAARPTASLDEEVTMLRDLMGRGVECEIRALVDDKKVDVATVL
mgnify:CR=1 FL=1